MSESNAPFTTLGKHLKYVRQQLDQSLAEVSGAVEIDEQRLARIEAGQERPTEDILLLLISHFGMQEQQALQLWELADYGDELPDQIKQDVDQVVNKSVVMLLATDTRAIYSDGVNVEVTKAGLTISFTQSSGPTESTPVSRVGMSIDQAEEVAKAINNAVLKAKYGGTNLLPPGPKR